MLCIGPSQILPSLLGEIFLITIIMKCIIRIVYGLFRPLDFLTYQKMSLVRFTSSGTRQATLCPDAVRSDNLVISATHQTLLDKPWYFPNPASYQIETRESGIDKVSLLDLFGTTVFTWDQPTLH